MAASTLRFYEKHPMVKKAVDAMFLFPPDIQRIIAKGFAAIAERDCNAAEILKESRTLGTDKVLSLYKSKTKKREYDHNPVVHDAMNYLMIMDEDSRVLLAGKILELVVFMQDYLKLCKTYATDPQLEAAEAIAETYTKHGPVEARRFIVELDREFKRLFGLQNGGPLPASPEALLQPLMEAGATPAIMEKASTLSEGIKSENAGMKIKGDFI